MSGKLKATVLLLVMYALGLVSGIAWQNYRNPRASLHPMFATRRIHRLKSELKLSPEQEQQLSEIFKNAHERAKQINEEVSWDLADIHRDSVAAIKSVLTPAQSEKFDLLHQRSHQRRHEPVEAPAKADEAPADAGATS